MKVIYVHANDQPNRFLQFAVDIQTVKLSKDLADLPADDLFLGIELSNELRAAGATGVKPLRRNLVYTDLISTGAAGYAGIPGDSQPGQANFSNTGEKTAFVYGNQGSDTGPFQDVFVGDYWTVHAPFHELLHTLGAVGPGARHASSPQIGHCSDEYDVVCGQSSGITTPCAGEDNLMLACGKDDYFNARGPITNTAGDPIWNVYDSQFLCPVAACHVKSAPPCHPRPRVAPLSRLGLSPRRFRARRGATITYRLSSASKVTFTVERRSGRRWKRVGRAFSQRGRAGANRLRFRRKLRRGSYRLVARVGRAKPVRVAFRVVG